MAEILIRAADSLHPDPAVDARGSYKRGDPVCVMPDGHPWGTAERDPARFYIIEIPGVAVSTLAKYLEPVWGTPDPVTGERLRIRRRRWHAQGTPQAWQAELAARGRLRKTWAEVRGYIRDKTTGRTEQGKAL